LAEIGTTTSYPLLICWPFEYLSNACPYSNKAELMLKHRAEAGREDAKKSLKLGPYRDLGAPLGDMGPSSLKMKQHR
jgi:hypothetical protein